MVKLVALILPLGLDTFAVAAALGMAGLSARRRVRVSLVLTALEGVMPVIGLAFGAALGHAIGASADYVAIAVLVGFGLHTLFGEEQDEAEGIVTVLDRQLRGAFVLGLSVSIDELAIGSTLGLLRVPVLAVLVVIPAQAFALAQLGLRLGGRLSERARESAERLAGLALAGLALAGLGVTLLAEKAGGLI